MSMKKTTVILLGLLLSAGCGKKEEPKSVRFYLGDDLMRVDMIARCNADGGRLRGSPDCRNASIAATSIAAKKDKEKKAKREATSQRKLASIRARQAQLNQEQQRLAQEAAALESSDAASMSAPVKQVPSYGAPTGATMVDVSPQPAPPPVIEPEVIEEQPMLQEPQPGEPVMSLQTPDMPSEEVATQTEQEWVVTPSQVQPSPAVEEPVQATEPAPKAPVRDPSTISLDDLPGSNEVSGASMPLQQIPDVVQEVLSDGAADDAVEEESGE